MDVDFYAFMGNQEGQIYARHAWYAKDNKKLIQELLEISSRYINSIFLINETHEFA